MPDLKTYLEYNDSSAIIWRSGNVGDEYKPRTDALPVINNIITLLEVPSETQKVTISSMTEITMEVFNKKRFLAEDEYIVNYANGIITFHQSNNGQTFACAYFGRGLISLPASRIYAMIERNPDVVVTLQDFIEEANSKIKIISQKVNEANTAIADAIAATDRANLSADNANLATENANNAANEAYEAASTTKLVFLPYVNTYNEVRIKYPNPEVGHTVQVYDSGIRYRWDGVMWVSIDLFGGAIPLADDNIDGLLSKEHYSKIKRTDEATYSKRVIMAYLPSYPQLGTHPLIMQFPFDGKIISLKAICRIEGLTETELSIETSRNLTDWSQIMDRNIVFNPHSKFDDGNSELNQDNIDVLANDCFRVEVLEAGINIQDITLSITIETKNSTLGDGING